MNVRMTVAVAIAAAAMLGTGCAGASPSTTPTGTVPPTAGASPTATPFGSVRPTEEATTAAGSPSAAPTSIATALAAGVGSAWTWHPMGVDAAAVVGTDDSWIVVGGTYPASGSSQDPPVPVVWRSADGVTWAQRDLPLAVGARSGSAYRVAAGPAGLVVAGDVSAEAGDNNVRSAAWRSGVDGQSWVLVGRGLLDLGPCVEGCPTLMAVALRETTVVVTGYRITPKGNLEADVWSAAGDGAWQQTALPAGGTGLRVAAETSVAATKAGFIIAGSVCDTAGMNCRAVTWTSTDGVAWAGPSELPGGAGCGSLRVVDGGGHLALLGQRCVAGCKLTAWSSPDGATWAKGNLEAGKVTSPERGLLTYAGGRFLVAGSRAGHVEFWSSPDGAAWAKVPQSTQLWQDIEETLFNDLGGRPNAAMAIGWGPATTRGVWTSP